MAIFGRKFYRLPKIVPCRGGNWVVWCVGIKIGTLVTPKVFPLSLTSWRYNERQYKRFKISSLNVRRKVAHLSFSFEVGNGLINLPEIFTRLGFIGSRANSKTNTIVAVDNSNKDYNIFGPRNRNQCFCVAHSYFLITSKEH